jgi:hypothetical protein
MKQLAIRRSSRPATVAVMMLLGAAISTSSTVAPAAAAPEVAAARASLPPTATWSSATHIDTETDGALVAISCPTTKLCVAIDADGVALLDRNGTWSKPQVVAVKNHLIDISCPSPTLCLATDSRAGVYRWNGHSWSARIELAKKRDRGPSVVSCVSTTRCVAVANDGKSFRWNGGKWSAGPSATLPTVGGRITAVSCPTSSRCYATVEANDEGTLSGTVETLNGSAWSAAPPSEFGVRLYTLSCPSATFCIAGGDNSDQFRLSGASWTEVLAPLDLASVDCLSDTYCFGLDTFGQTTTYNGTSWSTPTPPVIGSAPPPGPNYDYLIAASCPSKGHCHAVGGEIGATYSGSGLSTPKRIERPSGEITAISCATSRFCIAVDRSGQAIAMHGSTWRTPIVIDAKAATYVVIHGFKAQPGGKDVAGGLQDVSCVTTHFCLAVDSLGRAFRYNGHRWSGPKSIATGSFGAVGVSCPTTTFCMVISAEGSEVTYNGTRFSKPVHFEKTEPYAISCPTTRFCTVVSRLKVIIWSNRKWGMIHALLNGKINNELADVSCVSPSYCVALAGQGPPYSFDGKKWQLRGGLYGTGVSCGSAGSCLAVAPFASMTLGKHERDHIYRHHSAEQVSCPTRNRCMVASDNRLGSVQSVTLH